jgi:hypothetical protein
MSNFNPYLYQIIEFKACKQAHELHYAKKMQTSNTIKQQTWTTIVHKHKHLQGYWTHNTSHSNISGLQIDTN